MMKNVIKFPIERQRKDLISNEDLAKELRQNKIELNLNPEYSKTI